MRSWFPFLSSFIDVKKLMFLFGKNNFSPFFSYFYSRQFLQLLWNARKENSSFAAGKTAETHKTTAIAQYHCWRNDARYCIAGSGFHDLNSHDQLFVWHNSTNGHSSLVLESPFPTDFVDDLSFCSHSLHIVCKHTGTVYGFESVYETASDEQRTKESLFGSSAQSH